MVDQEKWGLDLSEANSCTGGLENYKFLIFNFELGGTTMLSE
jgi:hypothetical protein